MDKTSKDKDQEAADKRRDALALRVLKTPPDPKTGKAKLAKPKKSVSSK